MSRAAVYVDIHTHRIAGGAIEMLSLNALDPAPAPIHVPYSCGIHPWDADKVWEQASARIATDARLSAIGECGLDNICPASKPRQREIFIRQLEIANRRRLPVIIHCVRAFEQTMEILKGFPNVTAIFHGFIGSPQQARRAVDHGCCLSFSMRSLRSPRTVEALGQTPTDRLFIETDDSPDPIAQTYAAVAHTIGCDPEVLETTIYNNFNRIFNGNASME